MPDPSAGLPCPDASAGLGAGPRVPQVDREFVELVDALAARPSAVLALVDVADRNW